MSKGIKILIAAVVACVILYLLYAHGVFGHDIAHFHHFHLREYNR